MSGIWFPFYSRYPTLANAQGFSRFLEEPKCFIDSRVLQFGTKNKRFLAIKDCFNNISCVRHRSSNEGCFKSCIPHLFGDYYMTSHTHKQFQRRACLPQNRDPFRTCRGRDEECESRSEKIRAGTLVLGNRLHELCICVSPAQMRRIVPRKGTPVAVADIPL
jgi:hypothetical protein